MDFDEAVATHSNWKRKLRDSCAKHGGNLNPAEVRLDHKCVLGLWIYSEAARYSSVPEYTKLKYEHARFHMIAADLVQKANSGESIEADIARCSSSEFSTSSAAVVIAIMAMKKKLAE